MSGSAYLGPGVLIVNKEKNSKAENLSAQGFSWFVKTKVLKKQKNEFPIKKCPIKPIPYHVHFHIVSFWRYI